MTPSALVVTLAQFLTLAILLRAVLSWFPVSRSLALVIGFLDAVTDPLLMPIRRRLPGLGGLDLSPMLAIMLIWVTESMALGPLGGH